MFAFARGIPAAIAGAITFLFGEASAVETALETAFNTMKTDILGYIVTALPIALAIVGAFFGIRKAIKFFRSVSNNG